MMEERLAGLEAAVTDSSATVARSRAETEEAEMARDAAVAEAREAHFKRASSAAYAKLPATQKPMRRPAFAETSPLPENLRPAVAALARWKARAERMRNAA